MKHPMGLVGAGPVSKSFLAQITRLAAGLGPVAGPTYRLASRIVNSLKAGYPVRDLAGLQDCRLILISVPDESLAGMVRDLAAAPLDWEGKAVLLCGSALDSSALRTLRIKGPATGSLSPIEGAQRRYVVEGDRPAVREAQQLVRDLHGRSLELKSEAMALYSAGISLATSLFIPLVAASVECIAEAAGNGPAAQAIAETVFARSLRGFAHAGRKSWSGALAAGDDAAVSRELDALRTFRPSMERYYREAAAFALEWANRHPQLLDSIRSGEESEAEECGEVDEVSPQPL